MASNHKISLSCLLNLLSLEMDLAEVMVVQDLDLPFVNGKARKILVHYHVEILDASIIRFDYCPSIYQTTAKDSDWLNLM